MAGELVKLKRGTKATMPTAKEAGSILIATDTGEAYVDNSSTERVQLKDSTKLPLSGGTMTGPIAMGTNKVTSSATPSSGSDLTNKTYVDSQVINVGTSTLKAIKADTDTSDAITTEVEPTSTDVTIKVNHTDNLGTGTAGTKYGPSSATSVAFGGSFNVPNVTSDIHGHVTSLGEVAITLPKAPTISITAGNAGITTSGTTVSHVTHTAASGGPTSDSEPTHGGTFVVPQVTSDEFGHVTAITNRTITLPAAPGSVGTLSNARAIDGVNFNGSADINHYGSCSTAAETAVKTIDLTGFKLVTGAHVYVKFTVTNTAANPSLNVNSTGAKSIYYRGAAISASYLAANRTYEFIYNGTQYELVGDIDTNSNITYSAGAGLSLSGTTFSLEDSGVSAGSYGPSADVSGTDGATVNIPQITVDSYGRVTSVTNRVLTNRDTDTTYSAMTGATASSAGSSGLVPAPASGSANRYLRSDGTWAVPPDTNTTYDAATTSSAGLMSASDKAKLDGIEANANDYALPAATSSVMGGVKVGSNLTVSSGTISLTKANVVAALGYTPPTQDTNTTYSAGTGLSLSGTTFSHAAVGTAGTAGPSANSSPAFGGTFTVPYVNVDARGHVSSKANRTITLPQPKLTTSVSDSSVQFRNIVVVAKGTDPNSVSCPVGTIICVKE